MKRHFCIARPDYLALTRHIPHETITVTVYERGYTPGGTLDILPQGLLEQYCCEYAAKEAA